MKFHVYSNFSQKNLEKNEISKFHEEWKIQHFQELGQASRNGGAISAPPPPSPVKKPRPLLHARAFKFFLRSSKFLFFLNATPCLHRRRPAASGRVAVADRAAAGRQAVARSGATSGRQPLLRGSPLLNPPTPSFLPLCSQIFPHVVNSSSLLQHMPVLPILLLKTSNTCNF
jgi:hypothetical protein